MIRSPAMLPVLLLINRLAVGWYFVSVGWAKVGMEWSGGLGTFYSGEGFQERTPDWLPAFVAAPYGYALPWTELLFGLLLMLGLFGRLTAGVLTLLSASIAIALAGAGELLPSHHVMLFITLSVTLWVLGPGRYSLDAALLHRRRAVAATNPASQV